MLSSVENFDNSNKIVDVKRWKGWSDFFWRQAFKSHRFRGGTGIITRKEIHIFGGQLNLIKIQSDHFRDLVITNQCVKCRTFKI